MGECLPGLPEPAVAREGLSEEGTLQQRPKRFTESCGSVRNEQSMCKGPGAEMNCILDQASMALGEGTREGGDATTGGGESRSHSASKVMTCNPSLSNAPTRWASLPAASLGTRIAGCPRPLSYTEQLTPACRLWELGFHPRHLSLGVTRRTTYTRFLLSAALTSEGRMAAVT